MASAAFHFDAQASLLKKSATPSGTVTLTLDSTDGVRTVLWEVSLTCENSAAAWTITGSTSDGATLTVPAGSDKACIVRCTVNGGTPTGTEDVLDLVKTAKVYTGTEVIVAGETTESDQTYGWGPIVNDIITSGGGGGGPALSDADPAPLAIVADAGVSADASRADHAHAAGVGLVLVNAGGDCTIDATTNGATPQDLYVTALDLTLDTGGVCLLSAVTSCTISSPAAKFKAGTHTARDASDAYGYVFTPAAAQTVLHKNTITSLTDRVEQASSGAGKTRNLFGGLGASGSANGAFYFGLENGNTVAGGSVNACLGSLVSNASDNFNLQVGTPGSGTTILYVQQLTTAVTRIGSLTNAINMFSVGAVSLSSNVSITTNASDLYHAHDAIYEQTSGGTLMQVIKRGSFGPYSSATTSTAWSYTTTTNTIVDVWARFVASNDTDDQGATYRRVASFKNIAGTVTQIGSTEAAWTDKEDAGQTGMDATVDFSGTAIRGRFTTDSGDTVNGTYEYVLTQRIAA